MNEELQSTNEELQTINEEPASAATSWTSSTRFLESILDRAPERRRRGRSRPPVRKWNHRAEDLWGLRADEVLRKNFLNLDIGLPVERLGHPIRACLAGEAEVLDVTLDATNRRGRPIRCG